MRAHKISAQTVPMELEYCRSTPVPAGFESTDRIVGPDMKRGPTGIAPKRQLLGERDTARHTAGYVLADIDARRIRQCVQELQQVTVEKVSDLFWVGKGVRSIYS